MALARRALTLLALCAAAAGLAGCLGTSAAADGGLRTRDGDTIEISDAVRAGGLRFGPGVTASDRAWILAAVGRARPEAATLIAEADGLIDVRTELQDPMGAIGLTEISPEGVVVSFDTTRLNGSAARQRDVVVLHELGHVIDAALVPRALGAQLDAGIPRGGACTSAGELGDCAAPAERFADTFAKWALRGAVSAAGAGYAIAAPASLEDWGAPLAALAVERAAR